MVCFWKKVQFQMLFYFSLHYIPWANFQRIIFQLPYLLFPQLYRFEIQFEIRLKIREISNSIQNSIRNSFWNLIWNSIRNLNPNSKFDSKFEIRISTQVCNQEFFYDKTHDITYLNSLFLSQNFFIQNLIFECCDIHHTLTKSTKKITNLISRKISKKNEILIELWQNYRK